ncbi:hypothetical protein L7F22_063182 [Adiantum nelumboides]|nr:hypothetical protein [Adiantum nelumboides]
MPSTSLGSPASHASVQFLNSVLSQRGPNALPYEENVKFTIRSHLVNLLEEFPSLQVKTETFTHNDGKACNLLQVDGTIPMYYLEVMYNIPVTFWLLEDYPKRAPLVFVTPTRDMIIKRPHRYVDPSGLVSVPYLQNWVYPRSNLVELVRSLSLAFGQDPPLYSKPAYQSMNPPHGMGMGAMMSQTPPSASTAPSGLQPRASMSPGHGVGAYPPSTSMSQIPSTSPYGGSPSTFSPHHAYPPYRHTTLSSHAPARTDPPSEVFKRNAINTLVERFQRDVTEMRKAKEMEMDKLANVQGILRQREEISKKGLQELSHEKEALEQQLQTVLTNTDVLETWVKGNKKSDTDVDIDNAFEPCDALSKQLLECTSSDLAIEDVLYSLDKAVQEGVMPVDLYLKHVRTFSREQFFHRATAVKVRAAQAQLQVAAIAGRAMPYGL